MVCDVLYILRTREESYVSKGFRDLADIYMICIIWSMSDIIMISTPALS